MRRLAVALLLFATAASAQPPQHLVAELPTCATAFYHATYWVTDGADDQDCTVGGGTARVLCRCQDGGNPAWSPLRALTGDSATGFFPTGTVEAARLPALSALSGAVTDAQVPNTVTIDLATLATTATTANAGDSATSFFSTGTVEAARLPALSGLTGAVTDAQVPDSITVTLAGTATALAANPADCSANQFANAIAASGALTCAAIADADVPNSITVDLATTATTANAGDSAAAFFSAGTVEVARGGTGAAPGADDQVLVADSTSAATWRAVNDCTGAGKALTYTASTNTYGCNTINGGGATTLTSTTLQSDAVIATYTAITGLAFTPAASTNYLIDCFIVYTSTAATTGINFAWDVPTGAVIHMDGFTKTVATGANEGFSQNSDNVGTATSAAVVTTENSAILHAQLRNGGNATSTTLGFTPETANSVSVLAGSTCQVRTY